MIARRTFIKGASMAAITATTSGIHVGQGHAQQVPNSVGIEPPKLKAPANAADCHMHTYDPARFPMPPNPRAAPTNATVATGCCKSGSGQRASSLCSPATMRPTTG